MQRLSVLSLPFLLAACAGLPPQLALVSQAADGVSYVFTGKTGTDHLFSGAMKKDCAFSRAVQGQAICKDHPENSKLAQAQSRVEGGHPGAALDRPIGDDETVALDPVLLPREMAGLAPALGGTARPPRTSVIGPAAFADPRPLVSAPAITALVQRSAGQRSSGPGSRPAAPKPVAATASQGEKAPKAATVKPKPPQTKPPQTKPSRLKRARTPRADPSYYVVVGTYRNWVTAIENAGRQSQGVASVVTARKNGRKTHRVLIGPFDRRGASDIRRLVAEEGYGSAWLVRSCGNPAVRGSSIGEPGTGEPGVPGAARPCMDLAKIWR
jgi:hypothetical protein